MMNTDCRRPVLITVAGLFVVCRMWSQTDAVRNWVAPLYWQPSAREAVLTRQALEERLGTQGMTPEATGGSSVVPLVFVAVTPCRMMDTRGYDSTFVSATVYGPPALTAGGTRTVPVAGVTAGYCTLPATAQAVSVNVTLWPTPGTQVQWITLWPAGVAKPAASTINDYQGTMYNSANGITIYGINNAAIVPLGTGGAFSIYVTNATNLFIDVNGYYAAIGDSNGNTTLGIGALQNNTGTGNTAAGDLALQNNATGWYNTASGANALQANTTGSDNTATGYNALLNDTASGNTASGTYALQTNTSGGSNTAAGVSSMYYNTAGSYNTASGGYSLWTNTTGGNNTAAGYSALLSNSTGSNNIAIGYYAASGVSAAASNNIHIGTKGASGDSGTIRIGGNTQLGDAAAQTQFFASGIRGETTGSSNTVPVVIDINGQLGTTSSSRAGKEDIEDMGDTTDTLMSLRPVRFHYRKYGSDSPLQYGLIAEEVAEVAPDLVARKRDGQIETVFYDKVNAMLLNQVQTQQRLIESQEQELESQRLDIRRLEGRLTELENRAK